MSKHAELNAETIYWQPQSDWSRMHDDGRMEYGLNTFLPSLRNLMQMATQIAKGELYAIRLEIECGGRTSEYREIWADQTQWMKGTYDCFELKVESKIDHTGHLTWFIYGREPGVDSVFSSWPYMAPDFALAWFIAAVWEGHNEWLLEQPAYTGGFA